MGNLKTDRYLFSLLVGSWLNCVKVMHTFFFSCSYSVHCLISSSFLTSCRPLRISSPAGSAAGGTSEGPSSPPSPRGMSSQCSSNLPSPLGASIKPGIQIWSQDLDINSSRAAALTSAPSPSALQDNTSQDTQSSSEIFACQTKWKRIVWDEVWQ